MRLFQIFVTLLFFAIVVYTAVTIANHGWNLFPIFFGDIVAMTWPGQFNFDFMGFLLLSGLWVSWRHDYSPAGIALGLVAVVGGVMFLSVYLLVASVQAGGDYKALLLGKHRVGN